MADDATILVEHGISPSAQRVAIAKFVLHTDEHPSADEVWTRVKKLFPHVSRATVYNTLKLFVQKGLLRPVVLKEGCVSFDPRIARHHHFIDEQSGRIHDVAWDDVRVADIENLEGFEVRDYQVVMRGTKTGRD